MDSEVFHKASPASDPEAALVEAAGLRWLADATGSGGPRIAHVINARPGALDIERIHQVPATPESVHAAGVAVARLHGSLPADTQFGTLPTDHPNGHPALWGPAEDQIPLGTASFASWGEWLATQRLAPVVERLGTRADPGELGVLQVLMDRLAQGHHDAETPAARVHGDLWNGNLLFTDRPPALGRRSQDSAPGVANSVPVHAVLIDPAAHAGHRMDDIAMVHLFGVPYLEEFMAGYLSEHALAPDWEQRIPLHQVFALAGHWALFGAAYREPTLAAAKASLELST